jgi:hypothetical protein
MPESTVVKNMRDGIIDIIVGANSYRIAYEAGTLQLNIPGPSISNYKDRGEFAETLHGQPSLRYNEDQPMTGSFTAYLRDLSDGSYVTAAEFVLKSGQYLSAWGSTMGADAEVPTVDLKWTIKGTVHGDAADHTATLQWVHITGALADGNPNMVTLSFTSFDLYPTVT